MNNYKGHTDDTDDTDIIGRKKLLTNTDDTDGTGNTEKEIFSLTDNDTYERNSKHKYQ